MATTISRAALDTTILTRLRSLAHVTVYDGFVPETPPTLSPTDPRVKPYVVYYSPAGVPDVDTDLADCGGDLVCTMQVTVAAGDRANYAETVDKVTALLHHWAPDLGDDLSVSWLTPPPGYDPGTVRVDVAESPPRFWLPLQYTTTIST